MPWRNRQNTSDDDAVEVAASSVGMVSRKSAGTITFLRPMRSAIRPTMGAARATPKVVALTVRLTCNSEA